MPKTPLKGVPTDERVRETHAYLDGQMVHAQGEFTSRSGAKAKYPGGFGIAAEDINCRCTVKYTLMKKDAFLAQGGVIPGEENAANGLTDSGDGGIIESRKKSNNSREGYRFVSDDEFNNLTIAARKKGAYILRGGEEVEAHLDRMGADALIVGDVLMFRKDTCISEILEETYHYEQNLNGLNNDKDIILRSILNEIDAKEYLIDNAEKYKIPRKEMELTKKQLEFYRQELQRYEEK